MTVDFKFGVGVTVWVLQRVSNEELMVRRITISDITVKSDGAVVYGYGSPKGCTYAETQLFNTQAELLASIPNMLAAIEDCWRMRLATGNIQ